MRRVKSLPLSESVAFFYSMHYAEKLNYENRYICIGGERH